MGVLVHGIDSTEDDQRPWAPCRADQPSCGFLSDRMSASFVFKEKGTNTFGGGGVILNPHYNRLFCFYGGDGGTRGKLCHPPGATSTCVPGCHERPTDMWCRAAVATSSWCDGLPWHPEDLAAAVQLDAVSSAYNEAIVDAFYWKEQLPHSVEAIITTPNNPSDEAMHRRFLHTYRLTEDDVPLVVFNKDRHDRPFQLYGARQQDDPNARLDYRVNGMSRRWTDPAQRAGGGGGGGGSARPTVQEQAQQWLANGERPGPALVIG